MGQVEKLEESDAVAELLNTEVTSEQRRKVKYLLESFPNTTSLLLVIESVLREQYNDAAAEGLIATDAPAVTADLLAGIIRAFAAQEATEI